MSEILSRREDGVLDIRLNRPDKKNAITQAMYARLAELVREGQADPAVRALLFTGEGDSFCAGNDIADFMAVAQGGVAQGPDAPVFRFLRALAEIDKPLVAGVKGRAVGIGFTLLLHCDLVVVSEDALLSVPFVNLALAPEAASTLLLPAVIGHQRAFELFALGEPLAGPKAVEWGLANRCTHAPAVDDEARRLAEKLAARAPGSIRWTKRLMRDSERLWTLMQAEGEAFGAQLKSPEAMEAFMAFSQKRKPDFSRF